MVLVSNVTSSLTADRRSILCRHLMALSSFTGSTRIPDNPAGEIVREGRMERGGGREGGRERGRKGGREGEEGESRMTQRVRERGRRCAHLF